MNVIYDVKRLSLSLNRQVGVGVFCYFKSPPPSSMCELLLPPRGYVQVLQLILFALSDPFGYVLVLPLSYYMCSVLLPVAM